MKLSVVTLMAVLVATVSADRIEVYSNCGFAGCTREGTWHNAWGEHFYVKAADGCRKPDVPGVSNVCFDWGSRRGHFDAPGIGKLCFTKISEWDYYCGTGTCYTTWFGDAPCNWREAPLETIANSTAAAIPAPVTTTTAKASAFRA